MRGRRGDLGRAVGGGPPTSEAPAAPSADEETSDDTSPAASAGADEPDPSAGGELAPLPGTLLGFPAEAEDAVPPDLPGEAQAVARGYVGPDGERVLDVLLIDTAEQLDPSAELPAYFQGIARTGATLAGEPVGVEAGGDGSAACGDFVSERSATACVLVDGSRLLAVSDYRSPGPQAAADGLAEVRQALGV